ncbi:hypothetical protein KA047_01055 [Candidatus Saccharibacteria bacterium]|nr:hypothetical protein [Candidatus Saccharibacteria bacterium]
MYAEQSSLSRPHVFAIVKDYEAEERSVIRRNRLQFAGITLGTAALFVAFGALLGNETDTSVDAEAERPESGQPGIELVYDNDESATRQESNPLLLAVPGAMAGVGIAFTRSLTSEDY